MIQNSVGLVKVAVGILQVAAGRRTESRRGRVSCVVVGGVGVAGLSLNRRRVRWSGLDVAPLIWGLVVEFERGRLRVRRRKREDGVR